VALGEVLTFGNLCVSLLNFATCRIFSNNNKRQKGGAHTLGAIYWPNTSAGALHSLQMTAAGLVEG